MNISEVLQVCQELHSEGKNLSVALIKARLIKGTPLPVIIAGMKQFQASPTKRQDKDNRSATPKAESSIASPLESKLDSVLCHVARLEQKIDTLNSQVEYLTKQLESKQ